VGPEKAHCFEVLKTSIISASNNEGQTSKRISERRRAKKDTKVRGRIREGKRISTSLVRGKKKKDVGKKDKREERLAERFWR